MRITILAAVITVVLTATPVLAHHHHGHHRPQGHHHRAREAESTHRGHHAPDVTHLEKPRHAPVLDTQAAPGQPKPSVAFDANLAPDSQPGLWRMGEAPKPAYGRRPRKLVGLLILNDETYPVVSGGNGWSIPYGHWLVTPDAVGHWGSRHHAIGLNSGDDIPDPELHRGREGVEIHAATHNATAGCVGVKQGFDALRSRVFAMVEAFGKVWLHVLPTGMAITSTKEWTPVNQTLYAASDDEGDENDARRHAKHSRHNRYAHHHRRVHYASR